MIGSNLLFGNDLTINLKEGADPNGVLGFALGKGQVERYEIGEISLHDIFILKVKEEGGELDEENAKSN